VSRAMNTVPTDTKDLTEIFLLLRKGKI